MSSNLTPLFRSVLSYKLYQFFVLPLDPVAFLDITLFVLVKLVLTLWIISPWNKACYLDPVVLAKLFRRYFLSSAVFIDCPEQKLCFFFGPVLLCIISLFSLQSIEFVKNRRCLLVWNLKLWVNNKHFIIITSRTFIVSDLERLFLTLRNVYMVRRLTFLLKLFRFV